MTDPTHPHTRRHRHPADATTTATGQAGAAAGADAPTADGSSAGDPQAEIDRLTAEIDAATAQAADLLTALQRERAEFQNFRRRTSEEREREAGLAGDYLLKKVLAIADDFDRAIEALPAELATNSWAEGIAAIDRKLRGLLESEGVRPIEALGRQFDPREHEAITSVPATGRPEGEIVAEVQRGYRVRDRILRPALVAVAAGGGSAAPPPRPAGDAANPDHDTTRTN